MFGFGQVGNTDALREPASYVLFAMVSEISIEFIIDIYAADVGKSTIASQNRAQWNLTRLMLPAETQDGIDHNRFWTCFRALPRSFFAVHLCNAVHGMLTVIMSFQLSVASVWCTRQGDPCSCNGAGFSVFEASCAIENRTGTNISVTENLTRDEEHVSLRRASS